MLGRRSSRPTSTMRRRTSLLLCTLAVVTALAHRLEWSFVEVSTLTHWRDVIYYSCWPLALDAQRVQL